MSGKMSVSAWEKSVWEESDCMKGKQEQLQVAFAGLLHDIGKFKQRAYGGTEAIISPTTKSMEAQILPVKNDMYEYRHALFTYDFFMQDFFPMLKGTPLDQALAWELIAREAASHHNPSRGTLSELIAQADRASAGNDRAYEEKLKSGGYIKVPLRPIFSSISEKGEKEGSAKSPYGYALRKMTDDRGKACFPILGYELSEKEYHALYECFLHDLAQAVQTCTTADRFLAKLKDLLLEYTWCIPAATNDYLNDISLYDHSVTTMNFALALANAEEVELPICLCAIDVSGIQSFIFQSKYASFPDAAKLFRGRSFIVSAITTALKYAICGYLDLLPYVDCIDAGGKLTLMLPNSEGLDAKLTKFQTQLDEFLLKEDFGTMAVLMDYSVKIGPKDFGGEKFRQTQNVVADRLSAKRQKKFFHAIAQTEIVFQNVDLAAPVCKACGKQSAGIEDGFCKLCESQKTLGAQLPRRLLVVFSSKGGTYHILPGMFLSFLDEAKADDEGVFSIKGVDPRYPMWRLNTHVPEENTFEDIARQAIKDGKGKPFLGYVKIDVDGLGSIFHDGFSVNEYSLSRYVSLSRMLHHFFNVYMRSLLETKYPYAYTVLSGGDDVFIILPWNQAISLVCDVRKKFSEFCQNPSFHFSAGIVVAGAKEPFAFVNEKANEALEGQAKEFPGKNAVSYFGVCFSPNDLERLQQDAMHMESLVSCNGDDGKPVTFGFLYRLLAYVEDRLVPGQEATVLQRKYSTFAKLRYDIARNLDPRNKKNPERYQDAIKFVLDHFDDFKDENGLRQFKVMLVQVLYSLRTTVRDKEE